MAWRTTEEAPPAVWCWSDDLAEEGIICAEEEAACVAVDEALRVADGQGIKGRSVLELGCGRGACLRWARDHGASRLVGVDRAEGALRATRLCLGPAVDLVQAEAVSTGLPARCVDLVWSHGVVEHFRPEELGPYLAEAVRLSSRWVAFSAPNPACGAYAAFRRHLLEIEAWVWGYEEPLQSYAPALRALGCEIVADVDVGWDWLAMRSYVGRLPEPEQGYWRALIEAGRVPGVYTVVVARVPASEGS